ncbi:hypothetical protein [Pseudomonas aeruginosa]|nr:hypothetical protein [Pseudomonas aeruginosa]
MTEQASSPAIRPHIVRRHCFGMTSQVELDAMAPLFPSYLFPWK